MVKFAGIVAIVADASLIAEAIAAAHAVSLRQLYNVWSGSGEATLAQFILALQVRTDGKVILSQLVYRFLDLENRFRELFGEDRGERGGNAG